VSSPSAADPVSAPSRDREASTRSIDPISIGPPSTPPQHLAPGASPAKSADIDGLLDAVVKISLAPPSARRAFAGSVAPLSM